MKLVKILLLIHFVDCTQMYGSAMNFNGSIGKSHLKNKTKHLAHRTQMHYIGMEYQTALKDYEQIVLGMGEMEVMNDMVVKPAAAYQIQLGCQYNVFSDEQGIFLHQYHANKNEGVFDDWDHSYLHPDDLLEFLESNSLISNVMLYTEYNFLDFKCYGHPTKLQQNWVEIFIGNKIYYVQCLLFVDILEKPKETIQTFLYNVRKTGQYALVHFMQYDIFRDNPDELELYGIPQVNFFQDEDSFLV